MAHIAHRDQNSPTTQARRAGAAVLIALSLVLGLAVTLGGGFGQTEQGRDVAGKSWSKIITPSSTETVSAARVSSVITVDGKSWAA
jgi:hypothetical protein